MREIKFKGKRLYDGKWVYGSLFYENGFTYIIFKTYVKDTKFQSDGGKATVDYWGIRANTESQYTGLKDKNGVEIYDGDIISHISNTDPYFQNLEVHYRVGAFCLKNENEGLMGTIYQIHPSLYKVIGNIHDNPELLKGETL